MTSKATSSWWTPKIPAQRSLGLLKDVLHRQFPNEGTLTARLEREISAHTHCPFVTMTTSGTAALSLAVWALDLSSSDEVLVPDFTFIATANAVRWAGAKPILVDIDPSNFCMDPNAVRKAITPNTKAIMPVHVSGRAGHLDELLSIAKEKNLFVIEDAAECLTSGWKGQSLGTYGDFGCYSFSSNKTITTGQGGAVLTHSEVLHRKIRELKDQGRSERGTGGADIHAALGFNSKFTDLQAAVGLAQWEDLPHRERQLKRAYEIYDDYLHANSLVHLGPFHLEKGECPQWVDAVVESGRDALIQHLLDRQILIRKFWFPIHTQKPYCEPLYWGSSNFKETVKVSEKGLWFSTSLELTEADHQRAAQEVKRWSETWTA